MLEGICALNLRIQALKLNLNKAGYLFKGGYFDAIMGSAKLAKTKCLLYSIRYLLAGKIHSDLP